MNGESQYRLSSNLCGLQSTTTYDVIFCLNTASAVTFVVYMKKKNFLSVAGLNTASAVTFVVEKKKNWGKNKDGLNTASAVTFVVKRQSGLFP